MGTPRHEKINQLMKDWSRGTVRIASYLNNLGYQKDLLKKYVNSGWLDSLGYGAYKLKDDKVGWEGAVYALQTQKNLCLHPGGKTVFELNGYSHYLSNSPSTVFIYGQSKELIPTWMRNQSWQTNLDFILTGTFDSSDQKALTETAINNIILKVSTLELAALEMLFLVPERQGFDEAYHLMESLTTLRPKLVQSLLEKCKSVKVKRLFMYMAEQHQHGWLDNLDRKKIDLGEGKRVIVKNGVLDKTYKITVPERNER